jgi:hypothetical protein
MIAGSLSRSPLPSDSASVRLSAADDELLQRDRSEVEVGIGDEFAIGIAEASEHRHRGDSAECFAVDDFATGDEAIDRVGSPDDIDCATADLLGGLIHDDPSAVDDDDLLDEIGDFVDEVA